MGVPPMNHGLEGRATGKLIPCRNLNTGVQRLLDLVLDRQQVSAAVVVELQARGLQQCRCLLVEGGQVHAGQGPGVFGDAGRWVTIVASDRSVARCRLRRKLLMNGLRFVNSPSAFSGNSSE